MGRRVLVTGAAGIVGRACTAALWGAGFDVVGITRTGGPGSIGADLSGASLDAAQLLGEGDPPSAIVHLAAAVPHDARYPDTEASAELTRAIDCNVANLAASWGATVIYMSTCGLYDRREPATKKPDAPIAVDLGPYFQAKRDGEALFNQLDATIFRLSAPVGPGLKPSVVLSKFVTASRAGLPIEIWGSGMREQDFVHVDDVAALIGAAVADASPGTYNCASGVPVTMVALAEAVVAAVGTGVVKHARKADPCEGETARFSIAATTALFGWIPQRGLADMIRSL